MTDLVDGRFALEKLLGKGGFGEAYLARDPGGRRVVVKLLLTKYADHSQVTERFRREIVALARLQHPNVVQLVAYGICSTRRQPYYVMEFSPGESLDRVLAREGRLALGRALGIVDQLLSALEAAHGLGIVHRDLKPGNLLVEPAAGGRGELLHVIDFGLAKHSHGGERTLEDLTQGGVLGTPSYMAPEQCRGHAVSPATDIYATGCILFELLSGRHVFEAPTVVELLRHHVERKAPSLADHVAGAPPLLVELVARSLAKRPEDRPDATALRRGLASIPVAPSEAALGARREGFLATLPAGRSIEEPTLPPVVGPRPRTRRLGSSRESLPDAGDAVRGKLAVEYGGQQGILFVFAGTRLRFGRDANRGPVVNDLVLRAFPASKDEDPELVAARTREISKHHGAFVVTRDGVAVRDDGSTRGTELDGARIAAFELVPLGESFVLEVARVLALRGRIIRAADGATGERLPGVEPSHPVEALRLDRTRDGGHMSYILLVREATIGSGEDDAVYLPHPGVQVGHATLSLRRGRFSVGSREGAVVVGGRRLAGGELVDLEPGVEVLIGGARLRYSPARDEDMKPA
jgi:tRNA A-37 threonylcarbamoyl transferase component Bud32